MLLLIYLINVTVIFLSIQWLMREFDFRWRLMLHGFVQATYAGYAYDIYSNIIRG